MTSVAADSTFITTGLVTPRMVRSPVTRYRPTPAPRTSVDLNVIFGNLAAWKKSRLRRWVSRFSTPVLRVAASKEASMVDCLMVLGSNRMTPVSPENSPRTVETIMWVTANCALE